LHVVSTSYADFDGDVAEDRHVHTTARGEGCDERSLSEQCDHSVAFLAQRARHQDLNNKKRSSRYADAHDVLRRAGEDREVIAMRPFPARCGGGADAHEAAIAVVSAPLRQR
jgi:hypothetical protein